MTRCKWCTVTAKKVECHCMTVFGNAVLFDVDKNGEDTASPKTPMQWHAT